MQWVLTVVVIALALVRCSSAMSNASKPKVEFDSSKIASQLERNPMLTNTCFTSDRTLPERATTTTVAGATTTEIATTTAAPAAITADTVAPAERLATYLEAYWHCDVDTACSMIAPAELLKTEEEVGYECHDFLAMLIESRLDTFGSKADGARDALNDIEVTVDPVEATSPTQVTIPRGNVTLKIFGEEIRMEADPDKTAMDFTLVLVGDQWMVESWAF